MIRAALLWACSALPLAAAECPPWARPGGAPGEDWEASAPAVIRFAGQETRWESPDKLVRTERQAVAVHTAAGSSSAVARLAYDPATDRVLAARVWIVGRDGKVRRTYGRSGFADRAAQVNQYFWDRERVLEASGAGEVTEGEVFAWEIQMECRPGFGEDAASFQTGIPTARKVYDVIPPPRTRLEWFSEDPALRAPAPLGREGGWHWEARRLRNPNADRPAFFVPAPRAVLVRLAENVPASWQNFGAKACAIMLPSADAGGPVADQARRLVAGRAERWDRIAALAAWVQSQIVYLSVRIGEDRLAGYRPHPAAEVLANRFGDCKDKAALLVALLRAIGEDGHIVLLTAANPTAVRRDWPSSRFNHAIAAIRADSCPATWPVVTATTGRFVLFDPTDADRTLGTLPPGDREGWGLLLDPARSELIPLPPVPFAQCVWQRDVRATVAPNGSLAVELDDVRSGPPGTDEHAFRHALNGADFVRAVEATVHRWQPVTTRFSARNEWSPDSQRFAVHLTFDIPAYAHPVGGRSLTLVSPDVLPYGMTLASWGRGWNGQSYLPVLRGSEVIHLRVPAGYRVEESPDDWSAAAGEAKASVTYHADAQGVTCTATYERPALTCDQAEYEQQRTLLDNFQKQLREPVLFRVHP